MNLPAAVMLANAVKLELLQFCERVEIAGSIRRGKAVCGDIDLVVLPHRENGMERLAEGVQRLISPRTPEQRPGQLLTDGAQSKRLLLRASHEQCDLWIAHHGTAAEVDLFGAHSPGMPSNFGALLLTYTGSVAHNIQVVEQAKRLGGRWHPTQGFWRGGECLADDEAAIFHALFGRWIEPAEREVF